MIDDLLARPQYGEKWGRHWLDLVRFAETNGYERDSRKDLIWKYRDYVIRAFNEDKPYDRFVKVLLAGDELPDKDGDSITATGFYRLGIWDDEPADRPLARYDYLDDILRTSGETFLGMTIGCARCHDHKFDTITQTDYYAMQAIFAGVKHSDSTLPLTPTTKKKIDKLEEEVNTLSKKLEKFIPNEANSSRTAKGPAVSAKFNVETFKPRRAKFVRFTILKTNGSQPCIDELGIFSQGKNLALAANGARATSNGDFKHPLHKLCLLYTSPRPRDRG